MSVPQMTVAELIEQLSKIEDKTRPVQVWMPGTYIALAGVMTTAKMPVTLIEGNVENSIVMGR